MYIGGKNRIIKFCFANCFEFGALVNAVLMYLVIGFVAEGVRHILFVIASIGFASISLISLIKNFRIKEVSKQVIILYSFFLGYYVCCFAVSLLKFGITPQFKDYFPQTIIFGGACFLFGLVGAKKGLGKEFLTWLEKGSIIALPLAVYYAFAHLFNCLNMKWHYGENIGPLDYQSLAYLFMPYILAHLLSFLFEGERDIEIFEKELKYSQLIRIIVSIVYWLAILASGTRGVYLSVICAVVFMIIVKICERQQYIRVMLPVSLIVIMLFLGFVWRPQGMNRMGRWGAVLDGLVNGTFKTDDITVFEDEEQVEQYANEAGKNNCENNGVEEQGSQEENNQGNKVDVAQPIEMNREELYMLAEYEFKNAPIIGMGPMGYSVKYGGFPHNLVLELLCENGIVGAIIYFGLIIYVLFVWIFIKKKEKHEIIMLLFLVAYMVHALGSTQWRGLVEVFFGIAYGGMMIGNVGLKRKKQR